MDMLASRRLLPKTLTRTDLIKAETKKKEIRYIISVFVAYLHSKSPSFRQSSMHSCLEPTWPFFRI